jgi:hypothetical protein
MVYALEEMGVLSGAAKNTTNIGGFGRYRQSQRRSSLRSLLVHLSRIGRLR